MKLKFKSSRSRTSQHWIDTLVSTDHMPVQHAQTSDTPPITSTPPSSQLPGRTSTPHPDIAEKNPGITASPSSPVPISDQVQGESSNSWKTLKLSLRTLKTSARFIPPLAASAGLILELADAINGISANQESLERMAEQINRLAQLIQAYSASTAPRHVQDTVNDLVRSLERHMVFIRYRMNRNRLGQVLNAVDDEKAIMDSLRDLSSAVELFQIGTSINIETQGRQISSITKDMYELELFKKLDAVDEARYDAYLRTGCLSGTRVQTLSQLSEWGSDLHSPTIFWLSGMAGIGKSAIAHSFCQTTDYKRHLGASFFCSRLSDSTNNVNRILPTIAYQLAYRLPEYREALYEVLRKTSRGSYALTAIQEQARFLFTNLIDKLEVDYPLVVVIDALDECVGRFAVSDFLRVLLRSELPFKFLIATRPANHINKCFSTQMFPEAGHRHMKPLDHVSLRLHDIDSDNVEEDVTHYISHELLPVLSNIDEEYAITTIEALAKKSKNLFLFAFTAIQYISPRTSSDLPRKEIIERVSIILQSPPLFLDPGFTKILDDIYKEIFVSAYSNIREIQQKGLRASLGMVLCLREPLSVNAIAILLEEDPDVVRAHLEKFSSVLDIPDRNDRPVLIFHGSFSDYVQDQHRSGNYVIDTHHQHDHLASACLKLMNNSLREDICNIKRKETPNADIDVSVIWERIPPTLRYACIHWASHLAGEAANMNNPSVLRELKMFVETHLLHWLECLSLLRRLDVAFSCVEKAHFYTKHQTSSVDDFDAIRAILLDAQYTISHVHHFIQLYALEVYVSALVWLPTESTLKARYWRNRTPRVVLGLDHTWSSHVDNTSEVSCLTFSPNDALFACAVGSTVQIWDLETGDGILASHEDYVTSLAFSTDDSMLASGSDDKAVRIWNARTGQLVHSLLGHLDSITSLVFSPDRTTLASASDDKTVRLWNANTGELVKELSGHTAHVTSIVFLPDGSQLVSVSVDKNVRVWGVDTGQLVNELPGFMHSVTSIILSPNGSKLASCSDDGTLRIWHASINDLITTLPGRVTNVAFSPDGSKLVSSHEKTVCVWDAATGVIDKEWLVGSVESVAFSTDGLKLAFGLHDETVHIWDIDEGKLVAELSNHARRVTSAMFSRDGRVVSTSSTGAVQVWNADTGERVKELYDGHTVIKYVPNSAPWSIDKPAAGQCRMVSLGSTGRLLDQLWVWGPYLQRNISTSSFTQNKACIGYETGEVVILELSTN